jgi:hypothetical protein
MEFKNIVVLAAVVVVALIVLGFVSTILNAIVPLGIVAVVAFILGRMSTRVNLIEAVGRLLRRSTDRKGADNSKAVSAATPAAQPAEQPSEVQREAEAIKRRLGEPEPEAAPQKEDFTVRSEAEILADMKRREAEIAQKGAAPSADELAAALEERRRRLLGDQADRS